MRSRVCYEVSLHHLLSNLYLKVAYQCECRLKSPNIDTRMLTSGVGRHVQRKIGCIKASYRLKIQLDRKNKMRNIPILLTSSVIAHDTGVELKSQEDRIRLALESIAQWLRIDPELHLVLCDGSDFDFSYDVCNKFPRARIECLHFENNQSMVKQYGRGYGEGEIVRFALNNSAFIVDAGCFAKCTSKLWVENFAECMKDWNGDLLFKGVFLNVFSISRRTVFSYIDTRFYVVSVRNYNKYFSEAHLHIDAKSGYGLEDCFYAICIQSHLKKFIFKVPPIICGVGGGTGKYYKNTTLRNLKERLRLKLVRMNNQFTALFAI